MEFAKRKLKWYWLLLFIIYCGFVVFELFRANPYLYSHSELRAALSTGQQMELKPFPMPGPTPRTVGEITYAPRFDFQHTAVDHRSPPRNKNLFEHKSIPVKTSISDWTVENVSSDTSGFYLTGRTNWVVSVGLDGIVRWSFLFERRTEDRPLFTPLLDEQTVYAVHPNGEVVALNKSTGELIWNLPLHQDIVAAPFLWREFVVLPLMGTVDPEVTGSSSRPGIQLALVARTTGEITKITPRMDIKIGFQTAYSSELNLFLMNVDNKITAVDGDSFQIEWSQVLTDPIKGAATLNGSHFYVATLGAKIMALDASKKGKILWEADLLKPAAAQPTLLPIMNKLSVLDEGGTVYIVDAKAGKVLTKLDFEGHPTGHFPVADTWSARIKSQHIEEFKMDWLHKGWTTWFICNGKRVCVMSPKGLLISKIGLSGEPLGLPVGEDGRLVFFIQTGKGGYAVSQLMDEKEMKRLKAEEEAAAAAKTD